MTNSLGLMIVVDTNGVCEKSDEERHFSLHTPPDDFLYIF